MGAWAERVEAAGVVEERRMPTTRFFVMSVTQLFILSVLG